MLPKQGNARGLKRPILTTLNTMKLLISILVIMGFVAGAGLPHPKSDPNYEHRLPKVTATAHAQSLVVPLAVQKTAVVTPTPPTPPTSPPFSADDPTTWPACPDTQNVWAQDGQCHDKPVAVAPVAAPTPAEPAQPQLPAQAAPQAVAAVAGCGDNDYASYIYHHESGCRTDALNPNGACGLGQAYPCSKMACSLSDYACQNEFFTNYAMARYGSWYAAYNYWLANHNW